MAEIPAWLTVLKDSVGITLSIIGIVGGAIAIVIGFKQRFREFKWKQADTGRTLVAKMCDDAEARRALDIIDNLDKIPFVEAVGWLRKHVDAGDRTYSEQDDNRKSVYQSFDKLVYHFDGFESAIEVDLVEFKHVQMPADYYVEILAKHKHIVRTYIERIKYHRANKFLNRFDPWKAADCTK